MRRPNALALLIAIAALGATLTISGPVYAAPPVEDGQGNEYFPQCLKIGISRTTTRKPKDTIKAWVRITCRPTTKGDTIQPGGLLPPGYFENALLLQVDGPGALNWRKRFLIEGSYNNMEFLKFYRSDPFPSASGFWEVSFFYYGYEEQSFLPTFRRAKTFLMLPGPNDSNPN